MNEAPLPRRLLSALLMSTVLSSGCHDGPRTYDDCLLKASRESQSDRRFRTMVEGCKRQFPNR